MNINKDAVKKLWGQLIGADESESEQQNAVNGENTDEYFDVDYEVDCGGDGLDEAADENQEPAVAPEAEADEDSEEEDDGSIRFYRNTINAAKNAWGTLFKKDEPIMKITCRHLYSSKSQIIKRSDLPLYFSSTDKTVFNINWNSMFVFYDSDTEVKPFHAMLRLEDNRLVLTDHSGSPGTHLVIDGTRTPLRAADKEEASANRRGEINVGANRFTIGMGWGSAEVELLPGITEYITPQYKLRVKNTRADRPEEPMEFYITNHTKIGEYGDIRCFFPGQMSRYCLLAKVGGSDDRLMSVAGREITLNGEKTELVPLEEETVFGYNDYEFTVLEKYSPAVCTASGKPNASRLSTFEVGGEAYLVNHNNKKSAAREPVIMTLHVIGPFDTQESFDFDVRRSDLPLHITGRDLGIRDPQLILNGACENDHCVIDIRHGRLMVVPNDNHSCKMSVNGETVRGKRGEPYDIDTMESRFYIGWCCIDVSVRKDMKPYLNDRYVVVKIEHMTAPDTESAREEILRHHCKIGRGVGNVILHGKMHRFIGVCSMPKGEPAVLQSVDNANEFKLPNGDFVSRVELRLGAAFEIAEYRFTVVKEYAGMFDLKSC